MSFQTIIIVGRLGKDPEMRYTPNGQAVTSFSVATDRRWTDSAGVKQKETAWFRVSVWGKMAESTNTYLKKGSQVVVEGRLNVDPKSGGPRIFNRQDGTAGSSFEVTAQNVRFLSSKAETAGETTEAAGEAEGSEDEIPF
jgi:single-strand DNA-binding protein